ncbi:MAG TPA: hypothetical protein EYP81_00635 [Thermodesulfobacteriaceae bacterium]|nr:hypothetical protein [Thermodesulfobacteriaceae bacterium]
MVREKVKVKVVPCEIYSRVVGYFRPVQNWNSGKQQEFSERKTVRIDSFKEFARRTCGC